MSASAWEWDLAASKGMRILSGTMPQAVIAEGNVHEVEFEHAKDTPEGLRSTHETFRLATDQVLFGSRQKLDSATEGMAPVGGTIRG